MMWDLCMSDNTKGIILAAGRGKRMENLTKYYTKALLSLHGKTLIEWQMDAMRAEGIQEIAVITGYCQELFTYPVVYFHNQQWETTNMVSTMLCAESWMCQYNCIVSYSDIVYTPSVIKVLKNTLGDIVITYDVNWKKLWEMRFDDPLSDAEIFQYTGDTLVDIGGKASHHSQIRGQYMGLLKFTPIGFSKFHNVIKNCSSIEMKKKDMTSVLKLLLNYGHKIIVAPIDTAWCEIDNEKDYLICKRLFS